MRRLRTVLIILGLLLGFGASHKLFTPLRTDSQKTASLAITAKVDLGTTIEVYVNGNYDRPLRQHLEDGVRTRYLFDNAPSSIDTLRIDLTDAANSRIDVEGIELLSDGKTVGSLNADALRAWPKNDLAALPEQAPGSLSLTSTGNDPFIYTGGLTLGGSERVRTWKDLAEENLNLIAISIAALLFLLPVACTQLIFPGVLFLAATLFAGKPLVAYILKQHIADPSAKDSLGNAAFFGYVKVNESVALIATSALVLFIGAIAGLALNGFHMGRLEKSQPEKRPFRLLPLLLVFALFAVIDFPPLHGARDRMLNGEITFSGYDWGNVFTWDYLSVYGFLPYRDYWFCYSGDYDQLGSYPAALWRTYLVQLVLSGTLLVSIYELCERRVLAATAILLSVGGLILIGMLLGTKRYLVAAAVTLAVAAVAKGKPRTFFPFLLLGALFGWAFYREPVQLAYAAPGLAILLVYFIASESAVSFGRRFSQVLASIAVGGVLVAIQILILKQAGQLAGFIDFYRDVSTFGPSSAIPAPLLQWYTLSAKFENILLLGTHLVLGFGAFYLLQKQFRFAGTVLLALGSLIIMIYFKMLVRPHMAQQMIALLVLSGGLLVAFSARFFRPTQHFAAAFIAGCVLGDGTNPVLMHSLAVNTLNTAESLPHNASELSRLELPQSVFDNYYSAARVRGIDPDTKQLIQFLTEQNFPRFGGKFYVFGDDSYLYSLVKEKPCRFVSLYNTSDTAAQTEVTQCLEHNKPEVVVWDSSFQKFDDVPNVVRAPILYSYMPEHFSLSKQIGRYQILRPRGAGEAFDWKYWQAQLGTSVFLGVLPSISSAPELPGCSGAAGEKCWDFAEIESAAAPSGDSAVLNVQIGETTFAVTARLLPGKPIQINLSRLWFWNAAVQEGVAPVVTTPIANAALKVVKRRAVESILY